MASNRLDSSFTSSFDSWDDMPIPSTHKQTEPKMVHIDEEDSYYTDSQTDSQRDSAVVTSTIEASEDLEEASAVSFEQELLSTLSPYAEMYRELNIIRKKIGDSSSYQFGLFLMNDICDKLQFIMNNPSEKTTYCRIVVDRLWNLQGKNGEVNIIQLIFSYLSICDKFSDKNFSRSTFDGCPRRVKKEKYDKNYDLYVNVHKGIDQFNQLISDKFTNFCLIFKAFRTIIGKFVKHATGSWDIKSFAPRSEWKYSIWNGKSYTSDKSRDFTDFMTEIIDIYIELEKLSPEFDELHVVFSEAKNESIKQRETTFKTMKHFRSNPRSNPRFNPQSRQKPVFHRTIAQVPASQIFVVGRDVESAPPTVSAWVKGNPINKSQQVRIQFVVEQEIPSDEARIVEALPAIAAPDMDGFVTVKSKNRRR